MRLDQVESVIWCENIFNDSKISVSTSTLTPMLIFCSFCSRRREHTSWLNEFLCDWAHPVSSRLSVTDMASHPARQRPGKQNRLLSVAKSPPTKLAVNQHCSVKSRTQQTPIVRGINYIVTDKPGQRGQGEAE